MLTLVKAKKSGYLSGAMTNQPYCNQVLFETATADLRGRGWEIYSPIEADIRAGVELHPEGKPLPAAQYNQLLRKDFAAINRRRYIILLPGWRESNGARGEVAHALKTGKKIREWQGVGKPLRNIEASAARFMETATWSYWKD